MNVTLRLDALCMFRDILVSPRAQIHSALVKSVADLASDELDRDVSKWSDEMEKNTAKVNHFPDPLPFGDALRHFGIHLLSP